ncbi:chaperone regulator [Reticulomyxa filosa]|uniref:Chaperone regulator n=1 Tax=Reticulomyxa filosa TaxID=46433 RepID=X6P0H1_RETFI|nr:chaperone regulator [Reticulomyxa filosa]|eukprot:ETO31633.1 chaperone regulator [Reticulomyxa filosa]
MPIETEGRMTVHRELYDVLEVSPHASQNDITKSFRKLSLKYHPDRNPDDETAHQKFVEINHAYEILGDDEKRSIYDQYGEEGVQKHERQQSGGSAQGFNPFADFFGFQNNNPKQDEEAKGPDVRGEIFMNLKDLYEGRVYELSVHRQTLCNHCFGTGANSDKDIVTCPKCSGQGVFLERRQMGIGFIQQIQRTCPKCNGQGKIIKGTCHVCHGKGVQQGMHSLLVDVQAGTPNGFQIELDHSSDEFPDRTAGHIILTVSTVEDAVANKNFTRDTTKFEDLHINVKINLLQALVGYEIDIEHLDGHLVHIKESTVTKPNSVKIIKNEGMPIPNSFPKRSGDLHVHFQVDFPKSLTKKQTQVLEELQL